MPLRLIPCLFETKIPLGEIKGRIDHLAIDPKRLRLYVAELGNGKAPACCTVLARLWGNRDQGWIAAVISC
jgi:hypothetical protein